MSLTSNLRKAFQIFLMSIGVSSPPKRPRPLQKPAAKPQDSQ